MSKKLLRKCRGIIEKYISNKTTKLFNIRRKL